MPENKVKIIPRGNNILVEPVKVQTVEGLILDSKDEKQDTLLRVYKVITVGEAVADDIDEGNKVLSRGDDIQKLKYKGREYLILDAEWVKGQLLD